MSIFRSRKIFQRGGAGAGRGDDTHNVTSGLRNLRYSIGKETPSGDRDWANPQGIVRPQNPAFYDWALDPEMNPEHVSNKNKPYEPKTAHMDSDIPESIVKKHLED